MGKVKPISHKGMNTVWCHLYEVSGGVKFLETKRIQGREGEEVLFKEYWVSVLQDKKDLKIGPITT